MANPQCNCSPCQSRRAAQQRWVEKNRDKKRLTNAKALKRFRARRRAERPKSPAKVTDEELDRRALLLDSQKELPL